MAQVYFHCSSAGLLAHSHRISVDTIGDMPDLAARFVQSLLSTPGDEDWRNWELRVSNTDGEVILVMPFTNLLGKPH